MKKSHPDVTSQHNLKDSSESLNQIKSMNQVKWNFIWIYLKQKHINSIKSVKN